MAEQDLKISQLRPVPANGLTLNTVLAVVRPNAVITEKADLEDLKNFLSSGNETHFGAGDPVNSFGKEKDVWVNTTANTFWKKQSGAWVKRYTASGGGAFVPLNTPLPSPVTIKSNAKPFFHYDAATKTLYFGETSNPQGEFGGEGGNYGYKRIKSTSDEERGEYYEAYRGDAVNPDISTRITTDSNIYADSASDYAQADAATSVSVAFSNRNHYVYLDATTGETEARWDDTAYYRKRGAGVSFRRFMETVVNEGGIVHRLTLNKSNHDENGAGVTEWEARFEFRQDGIYLNEVKLGGGGTQDISGKADKLLEVVTPTLTANNYTLQLTDKDKLVNIENEAACTVTIPNNTNVAFPVGSVLPVDWGNGAGQPTFAPESGVTIQSEGNKLKISAKFNGAFLHKIAANTWRVKGALA